MAYVQTTSRNNRAATLATVALIHAGIGYLLITGLGATIIQQAPDLFRAHNIPAETPPAVIPEPMPSAEPSETVQVVPTPRMPLRPADDFTIVEFPLDREPDRVIIPTPTHTVSPTPRFTPVAPIPRGNPGEWITADDYPSRALRRGEEGAVSFRLDIDANGKVTHCSVTGSSGYADLDGAACKLLSRRARFTPGADGAGRSVAGSYSNRIVWRIPE